MDVCDYMYNWFILLYTWNKHNIVIQLYSNKIKKKPTILVVVHWITSGRAEKIWDLLETQRDLSPEFMAKIMFASVNLDQGGRVVPWKKL